MCPRFSTQDVSHGSPYGVMPASQGDPRRLDSDKMLVGVSASLNVESENESTNDTRVGLEWSWIHNRW